MPGQTRPIDGRPMKAPSQAQARSMIGPPSPRPLSSLSLPGSAETVDRSGRPAGACSLNKNNTRPILGPCGLCKAQTRPTVGPFQARSRPIPGPYSAQITPRLDHMRTILGPGPYNDHTRPAHGLCKAHKGPIQGPFRARASPTPGLAPPPCHFLASA